jgi:hypothetical protein
LSNSQTSVCKFDRPSIFALCGLEIGRFDRDSHQQQPDLLSGEGSDNVVAVKYVAHTFIVLGLISAIGGFASCRHFAVGDETTDLAQIAAAEKSAYTMLLGMVILVVGVCLRDKVVKKK